MSHCWKPIIESGEYTFNTTKQFVCDCYACVSTEICGNCGLIRMPKLPTSKFNYWINFEDYDEGCNDRDFITCNELNMRNVLI
jgi:hypothetical protein